MIGQFQSKHPAVLCVCVCPRLVRRWWRSKDDNEETEEDNEDDNEDDEDAALGPHGHPSFCPAAGVSNPATVSALGMMDDNATTISQLLFTNDAEGRPPWPKLILRAVSRYQ